MIKTFVTTAIAAVASLSFLAVAQAEDFPATPMNSGPATMAPTARPAAPMAEEGMNKPMTEQPMMHKRMKKKKMMMKKEM